LVLKDTATHGTLPALCATLGLPAPPPPDGPESKRDRLAASFDAVPDGDLATVMERFLAHRPLGPTARNRLQDLAWEGTAPQVPKRFRREVARALNTLPLYLDGGRFDILLERLWVLEDPLSYFTGGTSLKDEIDRHVHRNPDDWSTETLFEKLGAFDSSDRRFCLFLEGLASAEVRPDETAQRQFVAAVNEPLRACRAELRETGSQDGYPAFSLVSTAAGTKGRPKNLIFASPTKPDLRFRDAVDNDIEIVTDAEKVLVYDRPIGVDGLRWRDLQAWWAETRGLTDSDAAKKTLYSRLRDSLPANSPPQGRVFDGFYKAFGASVPDLPALLPEVWLHWDPRTVAERGADALLRHRMDFLLLMPSGVRVVVEVDGKHHYADAAGRADSSRYAAMAAADRELRLAGYEVFRFGTAELMDQAESQPLVKDFFERLFQRYHVATRQ
jgi:very-short-patch-repair endonuclease